MANFYCGIGGSDANNGTTWENRKATIQDMLLRSSPTYDDGDRLYVGPGVYRETVTFNHKAAIIKNTGTVTVTEGSKIVTGAGSTNWWPVRRGDRLFVPWLSSGTGNYADPNFTSVADTFEANCVGFCINIQEQGSYLIATVVGAPSAVITLTDVNGMGVPADGGPYNYWVPSNEGSYEIESISDNYQQITLMRPWSGPTYTGRYYEISRPIYLIGDNTGAHTDGIGGIVRITGSDDDLTTTRANGIDTNGQDYWVISGFQLDSFSTQAIHINQSEGITVEDCVSLAASRHVDLDSTGVDRCTVRRCAFFGNDVGIYISAGSIQWDVVNHFENIFALCYGAFHVEQFNNTTIKNCMGGMSCYEILNVPNMDAGGSAFIHDCELHYAGNFALNAAVLGRIVANLNNYWGNAADWNNVDELGGTNYAHIYIPDTPMLLDGYRYPVRLYPPSEWWEPKALLGLYGANQDMQGVARPTTKSHRSYGPLQDQYIVRNEATTYAGEEASLEHPDARITQFRIPISGVPVTVTVWVYLETDYAGTAPKLVVYQPGNTDVEASATGTTEVFEQLSVSYTPNAQPLYLWAELVSDNTAGAGDYKVLWQRLLTEAA